MRRKWLKCILTIAIAGFIVVPFSPVYVLASSTTNPTLSVRAHIQNIGWQNYVDGGADKTILIGTTGRSLRMESLEINLNAPSEVKLKYRAHVQYIGWQNWVTADNKAKTNSVGTEGRALRMEAVQIALDGTDDYELRYRAHVQNIGWQDWVVAGKSTDLTTTKQFAGTVGRSLRVEALQIQIVKKAPTKAKVQVQAKPQTHTHTYTDWKTIVEPSCNSTGRKTRQCTSCGETETKIIDRTNNHNLVRTPELDRPATCTEYGAIYKKCTVCGDVFFSIEQSFGGHKWNTEYTIDKPATCTEEGLKSIHCTREGCTATKEQTTIQPTGHDITHETIPATCKEGELNVEKCSKCDYIKTEKTSIGAKGHQYSEYVSNNDATCSKDGTKTATCAICGNKDTINDDGTKLDHKFEVLADEALPTCEKEGREASKRCTVCGTVEKGATIRALGHNLVCNTKSSECTGTNPETYCTRCNFEFTDVNQLKAFGHGHKWNEDYTECTECTPDDLSEDIWWWAWKNNHKSSIIWFVGFTCDMDHCVGFVDSNSGRRINTKLEGRRGDIETGTIEMKAPAARQGYKFDGWIDLSTGEKVGTTGDTKVVGDTIYVSWKDMCKGFEPQYIVDK